MSENTIIVGYVGFLVIYGLLLSLFSPTIAEATGINIEIPEYPQECSDEITTNCIDSDPDFWEWIFNGLTIAGFIASQFFFVIGLVIQVPAVTGITLAVLSPILIKLLFALINLFKGS